MRAADIVLEWDAQNGDLLGAMIRCPDCPCQPGTGCDGDGRMFRPYRLHGRSIDLYRDAEILIQLLDRDEYPHQEVPM